MSRPQTDFDGSLEVLVDHEAHRRLLVDPGTPVEVRGRGGGRRFAIARVGLSVIAVSGLCLLPASSPAEDSVASQPVVSATCQITSALPDGTPSGVLADGSVCVLADTTEPSPPAAPAETPEPAPPAVPAEEADPSRPAADERAASSEAASSAAAAQSTHAAAPPPSAAVKPSAARRKDTKKAAVRRPSRGRGRAARVRARARAHTKLRHTAPRHAARAATPAPPAHVTAGVLPGIGPASPGPQLYVSDEAVIPRFLIRLYKQAGRRHHIPWPILAAINEIETDFGRNVAVSSAGAVGWMQFMPATWRAYGVDADRDGVKDPNNPRDAIFAAARYLRASGARHNMRRAIFAYNHAGWYVDSVLLRAERIAAQQGERHRRLSRLFDASAQRLERQVLADPRITLYECGRQDIAEHRIDRRVLIALRFLAWSGLHPTVTSLECDHGYYTKSGNVSDHSSGNAVDISAINGIPVFGHQGAGSVTEAAIRELLTLRGAMRPHQIISLMTFEGADNTIAMSDHADHIHVGFRPLAPVKR